ncbi:MAG: hypothetical protein V4615_11765 [Bacteroidota bacterium]
MENQTNSTINVAFIKFIAIYEADSLELTPSRKEILEKLTAACKYNPGQVVYVNSGLDKVALNNLLTKYSPEVVLVFGDIEVSRNLTNLKKNYPFEINGVKILRTETLENLEKVASEKSLLWTSLKRMLNL